MQIPSCSINEGFARKVCSDFLCLLDPTVSEISDIRTVVSEAVTNCIVHAYKEQAGTIYISGKCFSDRSIEIKIRDNGCGISDVQKAMEPLYTTCTTGERAGLGFAVMQSFMDKVKVRSTLGKGTTVVLRKKLSSKQGNV